MTRRPKPLVLVILDGWGHREATDHNAIASAKTPFFTQATANYPHGLINASELHVGLPAGQMGNSEVGHMNIGSGRVLMQDLPKIDAAIANGIVARNPAFSGFVEKAKKGTGTCHVLGLLSPGGVHSHQAHILEMAKLLTDAGLKAEVHAFLDGRDTPPQSAMEYIRWFEKEASRLRGVRIASLSGRYYAMDRDKRWDRVQKAYDMLISGTSDRFPNAEAALGKSYENKITDEFLLPCVLGDYKGMKDGDAVLCANFRADRVREILSALLDPGFNGFARSRVVRFSAAVGMTEYSTELTRFLTTLFPPEPLTNILGEIIAREGMKQLRIAETEKYAHVTFFFNGGREAEFPGEERILIPSPKVATYDEKPEMSAYEVTDKLLAAVNSDRFDCIVVNYANTDMVGHTGDLAAATKAVEAVDKCMGKLADAVLAKGGAMIITADHGNAEMMFDPGTDQPHTAHTLNLVPAIIVSNELKGRDIRLPEGRLGDIAPTVLQLLNVPQPAEMTGRSLLASYAG